MHDSAEVGAGAGVRGLSDAQRLHAVAFDEGGGEFHRGLATFATELHLARLDLHAPASVANLVAGGDDVIAVAHQGEIIALNGPQFIGFLQRLQRGRLVLQQRLVRVGHLPVHHTLDEGGTVLGDDVHFLEDVVDEPLSHLILLSAVELRHVLIELAPGVIEFFVEAALKRREYHPPLRTAPALAEVLVVSGWPQPHVRHRRVDSEVGEVIRPLGIGAGVVDELLRQLLSRLALTLRVRSHALDTGNDALKGIALAINKQPLRHLPELVERRALHSNAAHGVLEGACPVLPTIQQFFGCQVEVARAWGGCAPLR